MFNLDALMLARIQFGFTIAFHIIFPALTIGMASYLAVLEGLWLTRKETHYRDLYHFWSKVFAVCFGMGVVSGLVMAYQFGTNWSGFSTFAGGVTGPLLAYEVLTAFFLEAGFLGVMLFGWKKVGPGIHFASTILVALGTLTSMTWILASSSWMHTPAGYEIMDGRVVPTDWVAVIFNPSFPYRLMHMGVAAFLSTALVVGATGAWHLLRGDRTPATRTMMSMALWMLLIVAPIQAVIGDFHGLNTLEHQPAKIAAIEGHWQNEPEPGAGVPLTLFGWPDMHDETTHHAIKVPHLGSVILTHTWDGQFKGLKDFAPQDRPNSTVIFWSFRIMVGLGFMMIGLGLWAAWARWRGRLYHLRPLLWATLAMGPAGLLAILAGWITTEVGRQPWVVYGVMRTADAVSAHSATQLAITLSLFIVVYLAVFGAGTFYVLRLLAAGPTPAQESQPTEGGPGEPRTPSRPLSAAPDPVEEGSAPLGGRLQPQG